jgi:NAD-dependent SIR2 family protein deacetylase
MLTVSSAERAFILAGVGVGAESGIPTFRGVGGLWDGVLILLRSP